MNESQISKLTPWLKPKYTMKLICVFGLVICLCLLSVFTILSKPAGAWLAITGEEGSAAAAFDLALFLIQERETRSGAGRPNFGGLVLGEARQI